MKIKNSFVNLLSKAFLIASLLGGSQVANAQVNISSLTPYTQNFDGLPQTGSITNNATITGLYVLYSGTSNGVTSITGGDGSTTTTGLRSFGTAGSTDRALGGVSDANTGSFYYGLRLKNTTGNTINSFTIQYTIEQWRKPAGNKSPIIAFHYNKNAASIATLASANFQALTIGNGAWSTGSGGGNTIFKNGVYTFVANISLNANEEVMLRWTESNTDGIYLGLDDITITPNTSTAPVYYSKSTAANLNSTANWGTNPDGTGNAPTSFTTGLFIIANRTTTTISGNWALGAGAKVLVAEGTFTIPSNYTTGQATIDVADNATLTINHATLPTLGTLGTLSTVNINSSVSSLPNLEYGNLIIGNGKKNLTAALKVRNKLTLNSKLELGNFDLTLEEGATIESFSATNYIVAKGNGRLKQTVKSSTPNTLFPVGNDTEYLPITLSNSGAEDEFSVKVIDGVYPAYTNNVPSGNALTENAFGKTWIIDEAVTGGSNVTVSLEVKTGLIGGLLNVVGSLTGFEISQAKIVHYENNKWDYASTLPTVLNAITGGYTLTRSGITSFSPFSMMSGTPQPLPVELVSFTAKRNENGIVCNWKTAQEKNNDFFTVERSANGIEFTEVGTVKGKGTTSQASVYSFTDLTAPAALSYYRLRQTDFDGTVSYSKIVAVTAAEIMKAGFNLHPNPSAGQFVLQAIAEVNTPVSISIYDVQGRLIKEQFANVAAMKQGMPIELTNQPNGLYIIKIVNDNIITTIRATKQ